MCQEVSSLLLELKDMEARQDRDKLKIWESIKKIDRSFSYTGSIFRSIHYSSSYDETESKDGGNLFVIELIDNYQLFF